MKRFARLFGFYLLFVFFNIAFNRLARLLSLPLYIDNVGTLLAAILGGYLPGVLVGYVTNLINTVGAPENAYYAGISVLIAVATSFLYRRGFFSKLHKIIFFIFAIAFIGGCLGSVLTYYLYGFGMGDVVSAPFAAALLKKCPLSVFWAQLISDFAIDVVDKTLTVLIVLALLKLIPQRVSGSLRLTSWQQNPLSTAERLAARNIVTRRLALRTKTTLIIAVIMAVVAVFTTSISYILYMRFTTAHYMRTATNISGISANIIDADRVNRYLEFGSGEPGFHETLQRLTAIKKQSPLIKYLYVYQIREDGCHTVFAVEDDGVPITEPDTLMPFDESFKDLIPALLRGERIEPVITDDTWGWLLTAYEPVYDSNGTCVCYACTDIDMNEIRLAGVSFIAKILSLFLGFFVFVLVLCLWLTNYHLTYPIAAMTFASEDFAYNSEDARDISVQRLKALDVKTGDEIENLYHSIIHTISETVGYIDDVQKKGKEIAHMQDGLIYIMADLVESRDQNTGDHVRKTAPM